MHSDVGLRDGDDTCHSYRLKLVEGITDYRSASFYGRARKYLAHTGKIIQQFCVALFKFKKQMSA